MLGQCRFPHTSQISGGSDTKWRRLFGFKKLDRRTMDDDGQRMARHWIRSIDYVSSAADKDGKKRKFLKFLMHPYFCVAYIITSISAATEDTCYRSLTHIRSYSDTRIDPRSITNVTGLTMVLLPSQVPLLVDELCSYDACFILFPLDIAGHLSKVRRHHGKGGR